MRLSGKVSNAKRITARAAMRRSEMQTNRSHESIGVGNDREGTAVLRLPRRAVSPDPSLCHAIEVWMRDRQRRFGDLPRTDQALHGWGIVEHERSEQQTFGL